MDADLVAYLDQRFAEIRREITASAVGLRAEIAASAQDLRAEIATSAQDLRAEIATSAQDLRAEIATSAGTVAESLRAESAVRDERLRSEISADTARHIGTLVESLMSKIELVAEGVRTPSATSPASSRPRPGGSPRAA